MKEPKAGLGITIIIIGIVAIFGVLLRYVFPDRTSITHLIVAFLFLEFWGGVLLFASTHEHKSFLFRLLTILFRNKKRMFRFGIFGIFAGFALIFTFLAYGQI